MDLTFTLKSIFGMIMSKVIYLWNVMQSFMVDY